MLIRRTVWCDINDVRSVLRTTACSIDDADEFVERICCRRRQIDIEVVSRCARAGGRQVSARDRHGTGSAGAEIAYLDALSPNRVFRVREALACRRTVLGKDDLITGVRNSRGLDRQRHAIRVLAIVNALHDQDRIGSTVVEGVCCLGGRIDTITDADRQNGIRTGSGGAWLEGGKNGGQEVATPQDC